MNREGPGGANGWPGPRSESRTENDTTKTKNRNQLMNTEIKFQWRTPYTHPQNSTAWNVERVDGDPDKFDESEAEDNSAEVQIGGMWFVDEDGEETTMIESATSGCNWNE